MEEALLVKYIVQEASHEEAKAVLAWIESSPENKMEFEKLRSTWNKSAEIEETYFDVQAAWQKFSNQNIKKQTKVFQLNAVIRWAAAAVIIIGLAFGINQFLSPSVNTLANTAEEPIKEIQLEDGSSIQLVSGTVSYPNQFNQTTRTVEMEGKAYFKVASNAKKKFVVKTHACAIEVLGTEFEIENKDDFITVSVTEGKVAFNTPNGGKLLEKGEAALYSTKENKIIEKEFIANDFAYGSRSLQFDKERLGNAIQEIEKLYGVQIKLSEALANKRISTAFNDESLENVLQVLAITLNIDLIEKNGQYILKEREEVTP